MRLIIIIIILGALGYGAYKYGLLDDYIGGSDAEPAATVTEDMDAVEEAADAAADDMGDVVEEAADDMADDMGDAVDEAADAVEEAVDEVEEAVEEAAGDDTN